MKSIKTKMTCTIGIMVFLMCTGIAGGSYINAKKALISNVSVTFPKIAEEVSNNMAARIQTETKLLNQLSKTEVINNPSFNREEIVNSLTMVSQGDDTIKDMAVINKNGDYIGLTDTTLSDFSDTSFYKNALAGNANVSDIITNNKTGDMVNVYAVPIKNNDEIVGVLIKVKDGFALSKTVSNFTLKTTGKAFVIDSTGTSIANNNTELVKNRDNAIERAKTDSQYQSLAEIEKKMINGESGYDVYTLKGKSYYLGYAPIADTTWSVAVLINQNEILSELKGLKIYSIALEIIFVLVGLCIAYIFASNLSKRIGKASNHILFLADGDLSIEKIEDETKSNDEVTSMIHSMNKMHESLRGMISNIKLSSENIDSQSENLSAISEEIATASQSVTEAIDTVSQGTIEQSQNTSSILQILDNFSGKLLDMVNEVKEIDLNSREIGEKARLSSKDMDAVNESVMDISNSFKEFYNKVTALGNDINKVNEITSLINSIADQTNLLALNAAIEAARAGEAGKGFSIVADEIRVLAEQTKKSSENISQLIEGVSSNTDVIVQESVNIDKKLNNQGQYIEKSIQSFAEIIKGVDVIVPKIEKVKGSAENINSEKEIIIGKVDTLASTSTDISASSEEISASSQEMNANTEEVAASAQMLKKTTTDMITEVNKFIL